MSATREMGDAKGRGLFIALGTGWMAVAAIGVLVSSVSVFIHLIGLADFSGPPSHRQRGMNTWAQEYGWELALLALLLNGATLLCAIAFFRRQAWARIPFQVCLALLIAEFAIAAVVQVQSTMVFTGDADWESLFPGIGPAIMTVTIAIGGGSILGRVVLAIASILWLQCPRIREQLEPIA